MAKNVSVIIPSWLVPLLEADYFAPCKEHKTLTRGVKRCDDPDVTFELQETEDVGEYMELNLPFRKKLHNHLIDVENSANIKNDSESRNLIKPSLFIWIAQRFLDGPTKKGGDLKEERASLIILLQSYITLGILEESRQILQEPSEERPSTAKAEQAFHHCITAFKEVAQSGSSRSICHAHDVKSEYLSCLKHLTTLISESKDDRKGKSGETL
ncbi:hypothetical protein IFM89_031815 [Coptis chinensis]|uniref:Uncharacterized protein n=1 Tax=Coptis chinensis TaxID=261450 RepID=A0A835HQS3_9MAGN|nr:hypothetical protein IFM89_031815 [Coptis chinensis]